MTFIKGALCELRVLERSDEEACVWTKAVNAGLTTRHLFTGSYPMRPIDVKEVWEREAKAGSVEFGVWLPNSPDGIHINAVIIDQETGKMTECPDRFIGTCGLYSHRDVYRSWEFRILIFSPDHIGKGIGTEATRLTVDYAFRRLNAHRVWLGVHSDNIGAIKCYEKVGFKREGVLRDEVFTYGKYWDAVRMGILETD